MLLAIDTATPACSAALIDGGDVIAARIEIVGRGHAERLVPMIAEVLAEAGVSRAGRVLVDCGPGSFTGVRVGLAAAIGLGIGWGVPVTGCCSLALLAAMAFARRPDERACAVALPGGHGELFVGRFAARPFAALSDLASLAPEQAARALPERLVAGSAATALIAARGHGEALEMLPDAAEARRLPEPLRMRDPRPIYGRAPDARPAAA